MELKSMKALNSDERQTFQCTKGSKLTARRDKHLEKQHSPKRSTEAGTQIDESERQLGNTEARIRDSLQLDLNATIASDSHLVVE
jgi:hypothetical protein